MNVERQIVQSTFFLTVLLGVLHFLAITFFFYSEVWWFDIPMHILGGLICSLLALCCLLFFPRLFPLGKKRAFFYGMIGGALILGFSWEIFEYVNGITNVAFGSYPFDVAKDLCMDVLGAYIGFRYFLQLVKKQLPISL
jgi:hypothetical protein